MAIRILIVDDHAIVRQGLQGAFHFSAIKRHPKGGQSHRIKQRRG